MIAYPILLPIGIVRVTGTEGIDQITVVPAAGIFAPNEERNRGAGRLAFGDTGEDLDGGGFLPLRDVARRPWLAPVEIFLNVFYGKDEPRRTPIHDPADRRRVTLAE